MIKYGLLCLMMCLVTYGQTQVRISGIILDIDTRQSIAYVNIGIVELSMGTVSDRDGTYVIDVPSLDKTITVSSIGYESVEILASKLKEHSTIELQKVDYKLDLVEITAKRFSDEEKILGVRNKNRGSSIGFGSPQLGTEIGAPIQIDKPTLIKSAHFVLNHAKGDSLLFRVNIYNFSGEMIGKNLLNENIYIKDKQKKGIISVDLSTANLVLDNDVLLTLEWLRDFDELGSKGVTFDTKKGKKLKGTYVRYFSNGRFLKLQETKNGNPCFYFMGKEAL